MPRRTLIASGLVLAAVLASGCTSTPGTTSTPPNTARAAQPDQSRDPSTAELTTPSPLELPFAQYFSIARQAEAASYDQWYAAKSATYRDEQDRIAQCMKDAGFKWFPTDLQKPEPTVPSGDTLAIPRLPLKRDEVETHGYGRWNPRSDEEAASAASAELNNYVESLGPGGANKFYAALLDDPGCGKSMAESPETQGDSSWYLEPIGAMQAAFIGDKEHSGSGSFMTAAAMQNLNAEWGACMAGQGALSAEDWQIDPDLPGPMNAFYIAVATGPDGSRWASDSETEADEAHSTLIGSAPEVKIAVADFDCRAQTDYVNRLAAAQADIEARWVTGHKSVLDQMVTTWEQQAHR